ncbi:MAG: HEAT repeat domain-containing protein [ANME-2 cluster archaeon]|jgi:HEAT repeat protein|nr:HEAT repeat domain-containing protein [ANME-2 cluster archaeon]
MVDQAEIHRKVASGDVRERREGVEQLRSNFVDLPDKDAAWQDLIRLTGDEDSIVRWHAVYALGSAFQHVPDKDTAWEDLHRLTGDGDSNVRSLAADALGSTFQHVPDNESAWKDLHRLTRNEDSDVRWGAADALGSAFQHVPDKDAAWKDLHQLRQDEDSNVRGSANHSLGKASIFKATVAESGEDFKSELNNAIDFFEKSSIEATYSNPSSFCLPFYRSFYTITFEKTESEGEVQRYLAEAKSASEGSKNKVTLLEAVENLANALSEAQKVTDFDATKSDLKTYMQYCNRAANLIGDAAEDAPGAAEILRRGLPIIGERIKELLEEVRKKAEIICEAADLPESELGCKIVQHVATALATDKPLILEREIDHILNDLDRWSHTIKDENEKGYVQGIIFDANNGDARGKVSSIRVLLGRLLTFSEDKGEEMPKYNIKDSIIQIAEGNRNVQEMDSSVNSRKVETESGDFNVTNNAKATKESQPEEHRIDHRKKTAIEIIAAFAVSVLAAILSPRYLEDLTPTASTVIAFIAFIILLIIILTQNRDVSS